MSERQQELLLEGCAALERDVAPVVYEMGADWSEARYRELAEELVGRFFEGASDPATH